MDNVILGYYNETHQLESFECLVGGLPKIKKWPFCYKALSVDVIEEYKDQHVMYIMESLLQGHH